MRPFLSFSGGAYPALRVVVRDVDSDFGVVAVHTSERRHSQSVVEAVIVGEARSREQLVPTDGFSIGERSQVVFHCLVERLGLSIRLWVECCRHPSLDDRVIADLGPVPYLLVILESRSLTTPVGVPNRKKTSL